MGWKGDNNRFASGWELSSGGRGIKDSGGEPVKKGPIRVDIDFIKALREKDNKAWQYVLELCRGVVRKWLKPEEDREDFEEIVSYVYEKMLSTVDDYEPERGQGTIETNFKAWISKTAEFSVMQWRDRRKRDSRNINFTEIAKTFFPSHREDEADKEEAVENYLAYAGSKPGLAGCLGNPEYELKKKELYKAITTFGDNRIAMVYTLHYIYGHTIEEIAKAMELNAATVNTWLHRYRDKFKRHLIKAGIDSDYFK